MLHKHIDKINVTGLHSINKKFEELIFIHIFVNRKSFVKGFRKEFSKTRIILTISHKFENVKI